MDTPPCTYVAFEAWHEVKLEWVPARIVECGNKSHMEPKGTVPVFDSEGKIFWVVRESGAGR